MEITTDLPRLDAILAVWADRLGPDAQGYGNHCRRMLQFCFALAGPLSPRQRELLQVAAAFHDLGIWSDHTVDYIPPSVREARAYALANGFAAEAEEIALMVGTHHQVRADQVPQFPLVEVFRRADLVDFSLGLVRQGLPRAFIRAVKLTWPNAGFHRLLMRLTWRQLKAEPLRPLPMMKW
ncbi:MAG: HD domain-containing protein [Proteobacteria bacterium]|nr:hypothetical protein [Methylibium sp.]MBY0368046.1 HD domain-containing protein [Burkholderiaceae bacterium]MCH8856399.1 HD domain-containing protein [Pseudomonadota bacterium]